MERPILLPSWVMKGTNFFPDISFSAKNVLMGDAMLPHQFGDPKIIVPYS